MSYFRNTVVIIGLLCPAGGAHAFSTPEGQCLHGRYAAAAKYDRCEQNAVGKLFAGSEQELVKFWKALGKCRTKYVAVWEKLRAQAAGTGSTCDAPRFAVANGTVTDNLTNLQWEQKADDDTVHNVGDTHTWNGGTPYEAADGTVFTGFLASLNGGSCFAGHCDWRLPTRAELQTILAEGYPCGAVPCIDEATFGPTDGDGYWTSTPYVTSPTSAWVVVFTGATVIAQSKNNIAPARAVRGGL